MRSRLNKIEKIHLYKNYTKAEIFNFETLNVGNVF